MGWRIGRTIRLGPFRWNLSRRGVGVSWGFPGFRYGVNAYGRRYISIGIPGTGIHFYKYLDEPELPDLTVGPVAGPSPSSQPGQPSPPAEPWWKQKNLG